MALEIEVFYSFQSPYSYLGLESIYDLESKYDIQLLWQPFSAKAAGQQVTPSQVIPDKLSYLFEDTKRSAEALGIPLVFPEQWPEGEFDPGRATRGAIVAKDLGVLMEYNYKVFHKWWGLGENPNDDHYIGQLCDELDVDLGDFLSKISTSDTRERVKGIFKRGKKLGVYDTPTFVIDKERFVGAEKVAFLAAKLERMGLTRKSA